MSQRRTKIACAIGLLTLGAMVLIQTYLAGRFSLQTKMPATIPQLRSYGKLMLDGYCPVSLIEQRQWLIGHSDCRAVHNGCEFHFHSEQHRRRFLENPETYTPVLKGCDVTEYVDSQQLVSGRRAFGVTYNRRIYLFKSEASLWLFSRHAEEFERKTSQRLARNDPFRIH